MNEKRYKRLVDALIKSGVTISPFNVADSLIAKGVTLPTYCINCIHCEDRKKYLRCVRMGFTHGFEVKENGFCSYGIDKEVNT